MPVLANTRFGEKVFISQHFDFLSNVTVACLWHTVLDDLFQWRTQKIFMGRGFYQWHMVVICICCSLFV